MVWSDTHMASHANSTETSSRIRVLPPQVSEKIAAGEVIERPASVVKELVENSIDAGSTEIQVTLVDGGKSLIEVLDNGSGMSATELSLAVQRHATSKLSTIDDLERLSTLGFRGEALPSVAAVSELALLSRQKGAEATHEWRDGKVSALTHGHFLGSPHGTRIQAQGLFSQVPARLKFLKSAASEVGHVRDWMERLALSHPETGFRLWHGDRRVLDLRPQSEMERVRAVLADGEDYPIRTAENELVRAHWIQGSSSPQMRKLAQVVNGRSVKDRMLQQAILSSFRQALLPGQFPAVAIFLKIDPREIDVNVHPAKTEVRFLDSSKVFRAIHSLISDLIAAHGAPAYVAAPQALTHTFESAPMSASWAVSEGSHFASPSISQAVSTFQFPLAPDQPETRAAIADAPNHAHPFQEWRFRGILFSTYLVYDLGEEAGLIDQHAAHERVRYEKLRKRTRAPTGENNPSQTLLIPEPIRMPDLDREVFEARAPLLKKLGFDFENFGEDSILFRALPPEWGTQNLSVRLRALLERLVSTEASPQDAAVDETIFESLASEACHSSIRAGDRLEPSEALALVQELFRTEHPWNCPHGRPTVVRVPQARFEEWFQRRV